MTKSVMVRGLSLLNRVTYYGLEVLRLGTSWVTHVNLMMLVPQPVSLFRYPRMELIDGRSLLTIGSNMHYLGR